MLVSDYNHHSLNFVEKVAFSALPEALSLLKAR